VNTKNQYIDVLNNKNNKLYWSVNFSSEKFPDSKFLKSEVRSRGKDAMLGLVLDTKSLVFFDNKKIISEVSVSSDM